MPFLAQWHGGVIALALLALVGIVDVAATPARQFRKGSKPVWWAITAVPGVGVVLWVALGRPLGVKARGAGRGKGGLTVVQGGAGPGSTSVLAVREQTNQEIERAKELNRRLAEWEAKHDRRRPANQTGANQSASQPSQPSQPGASASDDQAASPNPSPEASSLGQPTDPRPTEVPHVRSSTGPSSVSEELSDEELAATIERWRAELDN